jgi:small subunit ribosomal protein S21
VEVQVRDNNVRHYEKPSEKRAREKAEAVRRYRKLLRKRRERDEL